MEQKIVIAISREYASGGKEIGELLSEDLGLHYYDKEILKLAADESGINEALFNEARSSFKKPSLFRGAKKVLSGEPLTPDSSDYTSEENLFKLQAKTIRDLAQRESCIIVGRCAGFTLKENPNVIRVFTHAPKWFRLEEAAKKKSLPPRELEKYVDRMTEQRAAYFEHFTGHKWYDVRNYDLCLDSSKLGYEKCVRMIEGYMNVRFGAGTVEALRAAKK
ncbi:MAG: cytidylate kinase-like family protein [Lachnospiraceae bacterium]|nr:cytidylate kinase-like family protein [Lachnospiraceae bacterium]